MQELLWKESEVVGKGPWGPVPPRVTVGGRVWHHPLCCNVKAHFPKLTCSQERHGTQFRPMGHKLKPAGGS